MPGRGEVDGDLHLFERERMHQVKRTNGQMDERTNAIVSSPTWTHFENDDIPRYIANPGDALPLSGERLPGG